jgi:hypothetical protein
MSGRKRKFIPGVPCEHPGCLHHITHPCEGCGRIGGHWNNEEDDQSLPKEELELDSLDYLSYEPIKTPEELRENKEKSTKYLVANFHIEGDDAE